MDAETMRDYCLGKPGAWPDWPWGGGPVADEADESYRLVVAKLLGDTAHPDGTTQPET